MSSYIMRRESNAGYKWYIVTPKTVDGKLKRGHDLCIGTTEEAEAYLKARRRSEDGALLYRKFCESITRLGMKKARTKRKSRALL